MASVYALYMQVKQAMESGRPAWSMRLSPFRSGVDISALVGERSLFLFGPRPTGFTPSPSLSRAELERIIRERLDEGDEN